MKISNTSHGFTLKLLCSHKNLNIGSQIEIKLSKHQLFKHQEGTNFKTCQQLK